MDIDFKNQIIYCGIDKWQLKGYKGQGLTIFMDDVGGNHAECTKMVVQTILPNATVLSGNINFNYNSEKVTACSIACLETNETLPFEEFVKKHNIRLMNNSTNGGNHQKDTVKTRYLNSMKNKYNLIFTGSAGNGYGSPIDNPYYGVAMMISGCNSKKRSTYAEDEDIDFIAYTAGMSGTSFSAPFACGMAGLVLQKYPNYTQDDVYEYFKKHCEDLGQAGKDVVNGWGLLKMGDANEISPENEVKENIIYTNSGNKIIDFDPTTRTSIQANGKVLEINRILYNNENWFRLRDFEDVLGVVDVDYDKAQKIATVED